MRKEYNEEVRLQNLKEFVDEYANEEELTSVDGVRATIDIIEEQLNNYKKLLNAKPSEALQWFGEQWVEYGIQDTVMQIKDTKEFTTIKQALIQEKKILNLMGKFTWVENGKLLCGRYGDIEIELNEYDFESKEDFDAVKEGLKITHEKYMVDNYIEVSKDQYDKFLKEYNKTHETCFNFFMDWLNIYLVTEEMIEKKPIARNHFNKYYILKSKLKENFNER